MNQSETIITYPDEKDINDYDFPSIKMLWKKGNGIRVRIGSYYANLIPSVVMSKSKYFNTLIVSSCKYDTDKIIDTNIYTSKIRNMQVFTSFWNFLNGSMYTFIHHDFTTQDYLDMMDYISFFNCYNGSWFEEYINELLQVYNKRERNYELLFKNKKKIEEFVKDYYHNFDTSTIHSRGDDTSPLDIGCDIIKNVGYCFYSAYIMRDDDHYCNAKISEKSFEFCDKHIEDGEKLKNK